jgi:hypothetical protein
MRSVTDASQPLVLAQLTGPAQLTDPAQLNDPAQRAGAVRRQVLPALALAVAIGAAVLSMIAITADDIRPVAPVPAAVQQVPSQQPPAQRPAMRPNSQQASVSMAPFTGRTAKLDACGRPIVPWRSACR